MNPVEGWWGNIPTSPLMGLWVIGIALFYIIFIDDR